MENQITIKVNSKEYIIPTDMNMSLMEALRSYELIHGKCGGCGECSTCHVYIDNERPMNSVGVIEDMMLDEVDNRKDNSRLSCQIHIYSNLDGLQLTIPTNE